MNHDDESAALAQQESELHQQSLLTVVSFKNWLHDLNDEKFAKVILSTLTPREYYLRKHGFQLNKENLDKLK